MAGQQFNISFVIGAVDNLSLKAMQINERVNKAFAPLQKLGSSVNFLGAELGFNKIGAALKNVGTKGQEAFNAFKEAGAILVGTLATVGVAFNYVVRGAAQTADEIQDASDRIGISTDSFQVLQYAATQSGVRLEKLEPILTKFSQVLGEATQGNGEASQIFKALGVSINDSTGRLKSMEEILPSLADKISKIQNPSIRNAAAIKLFGKEGVKFVNVLADGSQGLKNFEEKARSLGLVLDGKMIKAGGTLNDLFEEMQLVFSRTRDAIGAELFPVMMELLKTLEQIFIDNKPAIIAFAKAFAGELPNNLKALGNILKGVYLVVKPLFAAFGFVTSIFGTANTVFAGLALIITGKLIMAIYALGAALVQLGIITAATPIGWIAIGIGLVIAAIAALIVYWEPIKKFFSGLSSWVWVIAGALMAPIAPIFLLIGLGIALYKNWEPILNLFREIGTAVGNIGGKIGAFFGLGNSTGGTAPASNASGIAESLRLNPGGVSKSESKLVVDFNNLPRGTTIKTEKAESPLDLNMGYGMATP